MCLMSDQDDQECLVMVFLFLCGDVVAKVGIRGQEMRLVDSGKAKQPPTTKPPGFIPTTTSR